jgi:hypothetical protein
MPDVADYPSLTRSDVEDHLARAIDEMAVLTLKSKTADARHIQVALVLGQQILDVCRTRLKMIDNGYDITGYPPPSLLEMKRAKPVTGSCL